MLIHLIFSWNTYYGKFPWRFQVARGVTKSLSYIPWLHEETTWTCPLVGLILPNYGSSILIRYNFTHFYSTFILMNLGALWNTTVTVTWRKRKKDVKHDFIDLEEVVASYYRKQADLEMILLLADKRIVGNRKNKTFVRLDCETNLWSENA